MVLAGAAALIAVLATGNTAKQDFIKIGADDVPSVKLIIGEERKITSVSTTTENGVTKKIIKYKVSERQNREMQKYAETLISDYGYYYVYSDNDFSGTSGIDLQLVKASVEADHILYVRIDYDREGYTVMITRGRGTLTIIN